MSLTVVPLADIRSTLMRPAGTQVRPCHHPSRPGDNVNLTLRDYVYAGAASVTTKRGAERLKRSR
jgi:hypothetical protein